jgi:hypothetical protein
MVNACPCCGRAYPKQKAVEPIKPLAEMSDAELRAYYAKTAHIEDIRFHLRCASGRVDEPAWRELLEQVECMNGKATPESKRQYWALCQAQRERSEAIDQRIHLRQPAA